MKQPAVIFGTGSFAEVVRFYLDHDSEYEVVAFTADREYIEAEQFDGLPLIPFDELEKTHPPSRCSMYVAVGYRKLNKLRAEKYAMAKEAGYKLLTYVSSKCSHWGDTEIGDNCFIFEDNTIQPFVKIGCDTILWSGNHIGHHVRIGDHCFISSHVVVSGHVQMGSYCFVGVNSTIWDNIRIGEGCLIGAAANIKKTTKDYELYVTERTRPSRKRSDEIGF